MRGIHLDTLRAACPHCHDRFARQYSLNRHMEVPDGSEALCKGPKKGKEKQKVFNFADVDEDDERVFEYGYRYGDGDDDDDAGVGGAGGMFEAGSSGGVLT